MLLAVPMTCRDEGRLEFNAHRIYGFRRLAHISSGFELVTWATICDSNNEGMQQPTILLRKPLHAPAAKLSAADFSYAASRYYYYNFFS